MNIVGSWLNWIRKPFIAALRRDDTPTRRFASAALDVTAINRPSEKSTAAGAGECAQCSAANQVGESAAAQSTDHQAGSAVAALAIRPAVPAAIDAVVSTQPPLAVITALIAVGGVPIAIVPVALPAIIIAISAVVSVPAVIPIAAIVPVLMALRFCGGWKDHRRRYRDRKQRCDQMGFHDKLLTMVTAKRLTERKFSTAAGVWRIKGSSGRTERILVRPRPA